MPSDRNLRRMWRWVSCAVFLSGYMLIGSAGWAASKGDIFDPVASLYEKGNEYFRRSAYSSAISVFQLVSDNHPEHLLAPEALFSIASAKHKMNDLPAAKTTYEELLRRYPSASAIPDAMLQLGTVQSEMGDPTAAKAIWGRLVSEYKGSIAAKIAEQRLRTVEPAGQMSPLAPERPIAAPVREKEEVRRDEGKTKPVEAPEVPEVSPAPPAKKPAREIASASAQEQSVPDVYVVKKGDSISKIARMFLGSKDRYKELAKYNKIPAPYVISVGQEIKIPGGRPAPKKQMTMAEPAELTPSPSMAAPPEPVAPPLTPQKAAGTWEPMPAEEMERAVDSIQKWVDNRDEGYESLQARLLEMQQNVRGQRVLEKQVEILKTQLEAERQQNGRLKQELIDQVQRLKEMKDKNLKLISQMEGLADSAERSKTVQAQAAELDAQVRAHRQRMDVLEKQNEVLSETLQKMRDAFDAQIALVKAYYDSQLTQTREAYEARLDTTSAELSRLRDETRKKDESLSELKRDYADLMKKTAVIQKEAIEEKQTRVSTAAAKQALEKAQDFRREGKSKEAEAAYKEALNIYPEYADAMNGLAYLYAEEKRNLEDAEKLIERAMAVDPQGRGYYLDTLGWIQYIRMAYAASLDALHESYRRIPVEDLPARAAVNYHLAKVYQAMSDKDKAFFHFIDAIKLAPRTRWASLSERELDTL